MTHRWFVIVLALFCSAGGAVAQGQKNGYMVTDPNGKGVYLIPEIIAEKTVKTAMSLPGAPKTPAVAMVKAGPAYIVQAGAFAVPANADRLVRRLEGDHYRVMRSKAVFQRRKLTVDVVSVGGLATRDEAERVLEIMRRAYGLEGLIVPPDPTTLAVE